MIKPKQTKEETIRSLNYELSTGQIDMLLKQRNDLVELLYGTTIEPIEDCHGSQCKIGDFVVYKQSNQEILAGQIFSIDKEYIRLFPCMGIERTDTGMNFKRYASTPLINRCSQFYNIQKPSAYKPRA
nr:MAG TPA: hypothetical protein [Caudoviricetes sp.]